MANAGKVRGTGSGAKGAAVPAGSDEVGARITDADSGIETVEPGTLDSGRSGSGGDTGSSDSEPRKRGRGRPPGSGSKQRTAVETKEDSQNLTGLLVSLHMMGAALLKAPEFEIEQAEAERLAVAVA